MVSLMTREDIILGRNMDFCSKEGRDGPLTPNRVRQGGRWWWGRPPLQDSVLIKHSTQSPNTEALKYPNG